VPSTWSVVLSDVEFGYAEGQPVLHGVSLQAKAGEHVAVVGRTGAGKTSALHLIAGLYRPWAGRVLVAGHDPARLTEAERNRVLGVVPQVVLLFSGTVFDNLTLGDGSVAEDAVYEAAAIAGADAFIRALPQGTAPFSAGAGAVKGRICPRGSDNSWRWRARWSTGRPWCSWTRPPRPSTTASDAAFRAALRERVLPRGSTVVTVAHRLTTALDADRVVVLDKGRIVEEGAPAALIASQGRFAALMELEAAGWDWRSDA
jgi:ATP-binding cassette subfamily B protein